MPDKFRTSPIEGYITDAAGNVQRNITVRIKEEHPDGFVSDVEAVQTDSNGYFVSSPLKKGIYSLYDGGVRLSQRTHLPQYDHEIPAFVPGVKNAPEALTSEPESQQLVDSIFLQIEPDYRDVVKYGHIFKTHNKKFPLDGGYFSDMPDTYFADDEDQFITVSRFDISYMDDAFGTNVFWRGVPGLIYDKANETQLIIVLDNFSLIPKTLKNKLDIDPFENPYNNDPSGTPKLQNLSSGGDYLYWDVASTDPEFTETTKLASYLNLGDIVMMDVRDELADPMSPSKVLWLRLAYKVVTTTDVVLRFIDWSGRPIDKSGLTNRKSGFVYGNGENNVAANGSGIVTEDIHYIYIYDGMTSNLNLNKNLSPQTIRSRFTVIENTFETMFLNKDYLPHKSELYDYQME